jgi:hypothetical protein
MTEQDLVDSAKRVQQQFPVHIAKRIHEMNKLPYGVMINPLMQQVRLDIIHIFIDRVSIEALERGV